MVISSCCYDDPTSSPVPARGGLAPILVHQEIKWQTPPKRSDSREKRPPVVSLTRWAGCPMDGPIELSSEHASDLHFITYSLKKVAEHYWIGAKCFVEGTILPGRIFMQGPTSERRRSVMSSPFDFFRVYFSQDVLAECFEEMHGREPASHIALFDGHFTDDRIIAELTKSLVNLGNNAGALGPLFVEGAGLALAFHLVAHYSAQKGAQRTKGPAPLAKWRLRRVTEYVEEHLSRPIYLADLSAAAGLSRMHFAAQFRAATGRAPHAYVVQRRIALAQQLLLEHEMSISDVADTVGFRTQAHFASVFKKLVGTSPVHWKNDVLR